MRRTNTKWRSLHFAVLLLALSVTARAQELAPGPQNGVATTPPPTIWRHTDDVRSLNLFYGTGSAERAPDAYGKFTFVEEIMAGATPKFDIEDEYGTRWRVKLGRETRAEVAATRLLWGAGYIVDEDYYVHRLTVTGLPKLRRGGKFVSRGGIVLGARLERLEQTERSQNWSWFDNPFLEQRELNGLRVMMSLLNNWDLKESNNTIEETGGEQRSFVSDLGATFGTTGSNFTRSKSKLKDYERSQFIRKVTAEHVDFVMNSRPCFVTAFLPYYYTRTRMETITKRIPRSHVEWLAQRLSQLSDEQIRDSFRAAGYTAQEVEGYTRVMQKRIAALNALSEGDRNLRVSLR